MDYIERLKSPLMGYYKCLYSKDKFWKGQPLEGKKLVVYCEQGLGDIIQFARNFYALRQQGCHLTLHCPQTLHRLFAPLADAFLDRDDPHVPKHDYHTLSMSVPFLVGNCTTDIGHAYLSCPETEDLSGYDGLKIGIVWEGNPSHSNNAIRSCPLEYFADLAKALKAPLFTLQKQVHDRTLVQGAEDLQLYGFTIKDMYDTAKAINALDLVICVDTSVTHLAGAMGKKVICLLSHRHDYRWKVGKWYPNISFIRQPKIGDWDSVFDELFRQLEIKNERPSHNHKHPLTSILLTGGIGDFLTLESHFPHKDTLKKVYYATRAAANIVELIQASKAYDPDLQHVILHDDFQNRRPFISKPEVSQEVFHGDRPYPDDWPRVDDWSIDTKFQDIEDGYLEYLGSSVLKTTLADIQKFVLAPGYVVIVPSSDTHHVDGDVITGDEWVAIIRWLRWRSLRGVVLNTGEKTAPVVSTIRDMTGETTFLEAVEIMKGAVGYIGIDSSLSVLAAQLFDKNLYVKSNQGHLRRWQHVYYSPKKEFRFVRADLLIE